MAKSCHTGGVGHLSDEKFAMTQHNPSLFIFLSRRLKRKSTQSEYAKIGILILRN